MCACGEGRCACVCVVRVGVCVFACVVRVGVSVCVVRVTLLYYQYFVRYEGRTN